MSLGWPRALDLFTTHLRARHVSPLTVKAYLRSVGMLVERSARPGSVALGDLRSLVAGLLTGRESPSGKPLAASTVGSHVAAWRSLYSLLADEELVKSDPTQRLETPRCPQRVPKQVLTAKDVDLLLNAAGAGAGSGATAFALRDRAAVELLYATGVRRSELCGLDLGDLNHQERELTVRLGKGGKGRILPVTRSAYLLVKRYLEHGHAALANAGPDKRWRPRKTAGRLKEPQALFLTRYGSRLDAKSLERLLDAAGKRAGLEGKVTPHTLRRTFATHLLRSGASLRHIQLLLGHSSLNATAIYLRLDADDLREEVLLKHPRERMK